MAEQIEPSQLEGSVVLVGITRLFGNGDFEQEQYAGKASIRDENTYCLVELSCTDGETRQYPFDARSLQRAAEGEYRLRNTGEVIENPDFLMTWEVSKGEDE